MNNYFESTRDMVRRVCAEADAVAAEVDAWQAEFERKQLARRSAQRDELVFKVHENLEPSPVPVQQQTMSAEDSVAWNQWFDQSLERHCLVDKAYVNGFGEALVDAIAEETRDFVQEEVKKLHAEIGELRADLNVTRALLNGKIVELKQRDKAGAA